MREIKFRVYIKSANKIIDIIGFIENQFNKNLIRIYYFESGNILKYSLCVDEIEFLQYTGLKDHSTELKELYRGDILRDPQGLEFEIFWSDGAWCIDDDGEITRLNQSYIDANYFICFDNIYQNPELLENK